MAGDLKAIQERGRLIIAVKDNLRPLGFRGADGQLQGFEIEIAQRLTQELLGRKDALELRPVLNQDRLAMVLTDQADIVIARITATAPRSRLVSFSIPYYLDGTALVTRDSSVRKVDDLGNRAIAVLDGSSTVETLRYRLPKANLISVDSYAVAQTLLERGEAIAFAADASILSGWAQESPQYHLIVPTLSVEPLCIVIPKGLQYIELQLRINQILTRWQSEGWLQERATYWGLPGSN